MILPRANATSETIVQAAHGWTVVPPTVIYNTGAGAWALADVSSAATAGQRIVTQIIDANTVVATNMGRVTVTGHGLTVANYYWLGAAGALAITQPTSGVAQSLLYVRDANTLDIEVTQAVTLSAGASLFVNDQAASGYFDIGAMRVQWGNTANGTGAGTATLPAAFASTNYAVVGTVVGNGNQVMTVPAASQTTTTFGFNRAIGSNGGAATGVVSFIAIGLHP